MRRTGIFSTYNRVIAMWKPKSHSNDQTSIEMAKSQLGYFGAGEAPFIQRIVQLAEADGTTYNGRRNDKNHLD